MLRPLLLLPAVLLSPLGPKVTTARHSTATQHGTAVSTTVSKCLDTVALVIDALVIDTPKHGLLRQAGRQAGRVCRQKGRQAGTQEAKIDVCHCRSAAVTPCSSRNV